MSDAAEIQAQKDRIVAQHGPWTAHDYELAPGLYTIGGTPPPGYEPGGEPDEIKLRRVMQIICDHSPRPVSDLRVLDLACLEGLYCVELALRGATVVGVEGREANIAKARFARDALSLTRVELVRADVRTLSREAYGQFDVVLCLGLLYHLPAADAARLVRTIASMCTGFAILDTQVALTPDVATVDEDRVYWGHHWREHEPGTTPEVRLRALWKSLDNETSFYFTRPSLLNLLMHSGFTSVYECLIPPEPAKEENRTTVVAMVGTREQLIAVPRTNARQWEDIPESRKEPFVVRRIARRLVPHRVRRAVKSLVS